MVGKKPLLVGLLGLSLLAGCGSPVYSPMAPVAPAANLIEGMAVSPVSPEGFFDPDPTWAQSQIAKEMKGLGVKFRPKVVIGWSSYVDDGSQVIHISRFKFSKRFREVAQRAMYDTTFIHLLRHETAHAFFNAKFHQGLDQQFTDAFGSAKTPYKVNWADLALVGARYKDRPEFVSKYAQLHPLEDFAETMGVFLQKGGDQAKLDKYLAREGKNLGLKRKFEYVALFMKALQAKMPTTPAPADPAPAPGNGQ